MCHSAANLSGKNFFFEKIKCLDARVVEEKFFEWKALRLGDHFFIAIDGGKFACRLPEAERKEALKLSMAWLWRPYKDKLPEWVYLPSSATQQDWERFALAAMKYAAKQTEEGTDPAVTIETIWRQTRPTVKFKANELLKAYRRSHPNAAKSEKKS